MSQKRAPELGAAIRAVRGALIATLLFSFVINVLMLAGPVFMLQIYDRVLTSRSMPTLLALFVLVCALFAISGLLDLTRSRILSRIGARIDERLRVRIFDSVIHLKLKAGKGTPQLLQQLDHLRNFFSGAGLTAFFDAPWVPFYLAVIFLFHWMLGVLALVGAAVLLAIALLTEARTRLALADAQATAAKANILAGDGERNAEVLGAMGMLAAYRERWLVQTRTGLARLASGNDRLASLTALSKHLRLLLQSAMLAAAAALAIQDQITPGTIVAASIILGRALAPVEQAIVHWRGLVRARQAYRLLGEVLVAVPEEGERTALPKPARALDVDGLRVVPPGTGRTVLSGVKFALRPGQILGVIGPSAAGKSSLARVLVGVWPPFAGDVRLDGAAYDQWPAGELGRHIGYVPQDIEMFSGTVRDNIARFGPNARDEDVIAAAKRAGTHEMVLSLEEGYETEIGAFGSHLSAGQVQRIALARALYGDPALVVLDEPNSNLDIEGDAAMAAALAGMSARNQMVVLISHRRSAIMQCDLLLLLERGQQRAFGPRDQVLEALQARQARKGKPGGRSGAEGEPRTVGGEKPAGAQPGPEPAETGNGG